MSPPARPGALRRRPLPPRGAIVVARRAPVPCRRRLVTMLVVMTLAFAAVVGRLVFVQGVASSRYAAIGQSQRVHKVDLPAYRGSIFDRNGQELAMTVNEPTIAANPRLVTDPAAEAEALAGVLGLDRELLQTRLSQGSAFVYLARTVPESVAEQVEALGLPGVYQFDEPKRFSPADELAAPLLGRVGTDNEGLSGLEGQFNRQLSGRPGRLVVEEDPSGREIPGGVRAHTPSARGDDLVLTIDRSLQYETERALSDRIVSANARGGMALVMDSRSGEVLALADLVVGADGEPPRPAPANTSMTKVFEPGSLNKLITIAAALEQGIVQPEDRLSVPGSIRVADHTFKEHDPHPTLSWSITDIMANSSNVGTIMIGQKLGRQKIDSYLRDFGFGRTTGLAFPGESRGLMLDPAKWSGTSIGTIPIGQGIAVTAMQMLAAYNTIAAGGTYVAPKLVRATVDSSGHQTLTPPSERRRVVSEQTADRVTAMLSEVVRAGTGTAAAIDGYTVAGKTGTARKPLEGARGYKEGAYVSSFAGFVPAEKPALTAMVILDEPTPIYGGLVAAPVFADISRYALRQFRVPPPSCGPANPTPVPVRTAAGTTPPPTAGCTRLAPLVPKLGPDAARDVGEPASPDPTTLGPRPTAAQTGQ